MVRQDDISGEWLCYVHITKDKQKEMSDRSSLKYFRSQCSEK
jgi:hypothetical protein